MFLIPNIIEIKKRREHIGLSQHQASLQAGLGGSSIYRIESGKSQRISHLRAREIAQVLGCQVDDICNLPERIA